jgi:hypothetical protein
LDIARTKVDIAPLDGKRAVVVGRYAAVERPMRGLVRTPRPKDHAQLTLSDGARVYVEPFDSPASRRPIDELRKFDGKIVLVTGTLFEIMPSSGQSPISPCVTDITEIREADEKAGE